MLKDLTIADQILDKINKAKKIAIISHRNPDADTIGCNMVLRTVAENFGKHVISACVDPIPTHFKAMPGLQEYVNDFNPDEYDLFIVVDCGSLDQISFIHRYPQLKDANLINIDHHPGNNFLGTINIADETAASTTVVLYELLNYWGIPISTEMATWLLFGIYFDTGSFMHSNTNDYIYSIAGDLMAKGANHKLISKVLFRNLTFTKLCLWGRALSSLKKNDEGVVVSGVTEEDFISCGAKKDDLSGLIDYIGSVKDAKYATLLSSDPENPDVRGSLRTRRDDVDVREIAKQLGGGGHRKASGFSVKGKLKREIHWTIKGN